MSRVHILDPVVADRIAAGEVVERPASVVKELVENALDAEARHVTVAVDGGGIDRIVVDDDGVGMDADDLALAVKRHATSKLVRFEDLDALYTLGFRGEALAAIGAVSQLVLETRPRDARHGWRLVVAHGQEGAVVPIARTPGTRATVTDLFLTVPARQKALQSAASEQAHVHQVVARLAVARPEVGFRLIADGTVMWETPGDGDPRTAIAAVYGAGLADLLIPVQAGALADTVRVSGFILPPDRARANRHGQVLAVNGRVVRNPALRAAAESAYGSAVDVRRHPQFWLRVTLPPDQVDPNAHPAKAEVRLNRERLVAGLIYTAVAEALRTAPAFALPRDTVEEAREASGLTQSTWGLADLPPVHADASPAVLHREIAELVPLAQWAGRYLLAQGPEGLYLIDQHAAHERVYYDRFRARAHEPWPSQPLLWPLSLTLTRQEWEHWQEHRTTLSAAGFEMAELGGTTVAVRAVPAPLADEAGLELVHWVLESLAEDAPAKEHPVAWAKDPWLATAACKAAVKAHRGMARAEMEALLTAMAQSEAPRSCPHGRPTLLVLSLAEVDRRFGR
jgi:DNA mismatch repair protein MutL